jgi:hypothetical protein
MFWRTLLTNTTLLLFTCTNNDHDNNDVNVCKLLFGLIQSFLSTISKPSAWDNKTNCGWFIHISVRDNRSEYTFIDWVYIVKMTYPIRWHLKLVINLWFVSFFDFHVPREPVHPHSIFFSIQFKINSKITLKIRSHFKKSGKSIWRERKSTVRWIIQNWSHISVVNMYLNINMTWYDIRKTV